MEIPRDIDELNEIGRQGINYEEYFGGMDLSEEEKRRRIALAEQIEIILMFFFLYFLDHEQSEQISMIYEKYIEVAKEFLDVKSLPSYIESHAGEIASEIVRVTKEHMEDEYYISKERGMLIGANEANALGNYSQQIKAVREGKKYKTWITERDSRVRKTHRDVDRKTIGIFEPFKVGDSLMMFPHDRETFGASMEEIANCRCVAEYS